jgi:hypothetical protein
MLLIFFFFFFFFWHYSPWWTLATSKIAVQFPILEASQQNIFMGWGFYTTPHPATWRTRVSCFVWATTFELSGMGGPTSSYATASISPRIVNTHMPPLRQSRATFGGIHLFIRTKTDKFVNVSIPCGV